MMDAEHICVKEKEWGEITTTLEFIREKLTAHVVEGDQVGGWRDRILALESHHKQIDREISTIKKGYWIAAVVGGLFGGLLSQITPEVFKFLIDCLK